VSCQKRTRDDDSDGSLVSDAELSDNPDDDEDTSSKRRHVENAGFSDELERRLAEIPSETERARLRTRAAILGEATVLSSLRRKDGNAH
jgi:hypothetical protein